MRAEEGSRTPTPLRADGFEPSAYAIPPPRLEPYDHATFWRPLRNGVGFYRCRCASGGILQYASDPDDRRVQTMTSEADTTPGRARVLVAEDEALIRLDLVELLTAEGYDVVGEAGEGFAVAVPSDRWDQLAVEVVVGGVVTQKALVMSPWPAAVPSYTCCVPQASV